MHIESVDAIDGMVLVIKDPKEGGHLIDYGRGGRLARLRAVLGASDKQTQSFLQPLLPLHGVQELLLTFVRDSSRSFKDWVWDPQVRQTLLQMRDAEPHSHAQGQDLDQWYTRAAEERLASLALQNPDDVTPPEFLEEADKAQSDGKVKFKEKNYYAAKNAFLKSIEAVLKHQQSEYYGKTIPAAEWDDLDMQERYVTLCNNVAVCGIKMKDLSLINEYATKALAVEETSVKALYAMTKLRLMEHRYNEANEVVDRALTFYPDKAQFLNLRKEIEAAERKQVMEQAELSEVREKQLSAAFAAAAAGIKAKAPALTQEEREQQLKEEVQKRVDNTPLPTREDDMFAAARLNVYFMKIKQRMMVDIRPRHNADMGEEPLFECTIANVKNEACKIVIEKLWQDKEAGGKLNPEDVAYLERFERARPVGSRCLQTRFDIEDVSPNKEVTEFKCTGFLNGEQIATANAISKKKAKVEVAKQVLAAAFEKNLLLVYDGPTDEDEDSKATDQTPAHGG
ncbi:Tetratricopeptide repeat-containing domain [Phytophthora cactorum]|nr:Tetratricopeptide repeat-containing domain [Phytophthora cactorum]